MFLSLVILDFIIIYLLVRINAKNVHLIVHHALLQYLAQNVLMDLLFKPSISLNLSQFKYAHKFVEMEKDFKQIVMTITMYQEMGAVKIVKFNQVGHVLEGHQLLKTIVQ